MNESNGSEDGAIEPTEAESSTAESNPAEANTIDLETYQRLKADFDNFRRRIADDRQKYEEQAISSFVEKLLPVLEVFEAGMEYNAEALKPVYDLFLSALSGEGLLSIAPKTGESFNPAIHQAVDVGQASPRYVPPEQAESLQNPKVGFINGPKPHRDVVIEVVRQGYMWKQRLLRPAQVKVGVEVSG